MDAKLLTEQAWKGVAQKAPVKDNGLQQALSTYEKINPARHDDRLKQLTVVIARANALKGSADPAVAKHLANVLAAAETARREITAAKAKAEKGESAAAPAEHEADERAAEAAKKAEALKAAEETRIKIGKPLLTGLQQAQRGGGKPFQWIATMKDPKSRTPAAGLLIAPSVGPTQQQLLTKATGSTRFLKGTCAMEKGKLTFAMKGAPSSLLAQIRESIQYFTKTSVQIDVRASLASQEHAADAPETTTAAATPRASDEAPEEAAVAEPEAQDEPERAPAGPKGFAISASVGRGGKNQPEDVKAVQAALNRRNNAGLGEPDGKCGAKTIAAIETFQKALGFSKPDGLVEPGRGTARALAGSGKITPVAARPKTMAPPKLGKPALDSAHLVWHGTRNIVDTNIKALKSAIKQEYSNEHPQVFAAIDANVAKLDVILDKLDHRLSDALAKANAARDDESRKAELKNCKSILASYIEYVKNEPLIDHIDDNPFGVDTKLEKVLTDSLTHMAMAIG